MNPRLLISVALMASLAACEHEQDDICDMYPAGDPATALATAQIDGRLFAGNDSPHNPVGYFDRETRRLSFAAYTYHEYWVESVEIVVADVTGPGAYPLGPWPRLGVDLVSGGRYFCEASRQGWVRSTGTAEDSIWVIEMDTLSGVVAGTFSFHGVGEFDGVTHSITDGTFRVVAGIYGSAGAETP